MTRQAIVPHAGLGTVRSEGTSPGRLSDGDIAVYGDEASPRHHGDGRANALPPPGPLPSAWQESSDATQTTLEMECSEIERHQRMCAALDILEEDRAYEGGRGPAGRP